MMFDVILGSRLPWPSSHLRLTLQSGNLASTFLAARSVHWIIFSMRCNIYISHLCYDVSVRLSVRLSVSSDDLMCPWTLTYVLDFRTWSRQCQAESTSEIYMYSNVTVWTQWIYNQLLALWIMIDMGNKMLWVHFCERTWKVSRLCDKSGNKKNNVTVITKSEEQKTEQSYWPADPGQQCTW